MGTLKPDAAPTEHRLRRTILGILAGVLVVVVVVAVLVLILSGVSLASDPSALVRIDSKPLAGKVEQVEAWTSKGRRIPVSLSDDRLTPLVKLTPGEQVTVQMKVRRPGWIGWALGDEKVERVTVRAPVAQVTQQWITVARGSNVRVGFQSSVSAVAYGAGGDLKSRALAAPTRTVSLGARAATGTLEIAAAPRAWETLGTPARVSWFPPAREPVLATLPAPGADTTPAGSIYLTFSRPLAEVLGGSDPRVLPSTPGVWREQNSHTLVFTPQGYGAPLGSGISFQFPHDVAVSVGGGLLVTHQIGWGVPAGSTLRLQQLLAQAGYLPLDWRASGAEVAHTPSAEVQAAVDPPTGAFGWRYGNTPRPLQALWSDGEAKTT